MKCQCYYCKNNLLWPEEQKALEDVLSGKTKMVKVTLEELLKEIQDGLV